MVENRLRMAQNEPKSLANKREVKEKFDHLWKKEPELFNPMRNIMERERIKRTISFIPKDLLNMKLVDLGCGNGDIARLMEQRGGDVDAVDIAEKPLKGISSTKNIHPIQACLPTTFLQDEFYDGVICTELIAYLPLSEYRLLFSEMARIVKPNGFVICSTSLDYRSENALQHFVNLGEAEFEIEKWELSYHLFYIRLRNLFEAPRRFLRAAKDAEYRKRHIEQREGLSQIWFRINSQPIPCIFWWCVQWISRPIANWIKKSKPLLTILEKMDRFFLNERAITHAIFFGKLRALEQIPKSEQPIEQKHKKEIWE